MQKNHTFLRLLVLHHSISAFKWKYILKLNYDFFCPITVNCATCVTNVRQFPPQFLHNSQQKHSFPCKMRCKSKPTVDPACHFSAQCINNDIQLRLDSISTEHSNPPTAPPPAPFSSLPPSYYISTLRSPNLLLTQIPITSSILQHLRSLFSPIQTHSLSIQFHHSLL